MGEIKIGYGPMMPSLEEQANSQGFTLGNKAELFEKITYSLNMVGFHVATDSQIKVLFDRFNKTVGKELKPLEESAE